MRLGFKVGIKKLRLVRLRYRTMLALTGFKHRRSPKSSERGGVLFGASKDDQVQAVSVSMMPNE